MENNGKYTKIGSMWRSLFVDKPEHERTKVIYAAADKNEFKAPGKLLWYNYADNTYYELKTILAFKPFKDVSGLEYELKVNLQNPKHAVPLTDQTEDEELAEEN